MLSFKDGIPIAKIKGGELNNHLLYVKRRNKRRNNQDKEQILEVVIPDGVLIPIPHPNWVDVVFMGGAKGAGKSTRIAEWTKCYQKMYPYNKVILFKRNLDPDPAFAGIEMSDIPHTDVFKFHLGNLGNSLVIMDDTSKIPNIDVNYHLRQLMIDILENGRKPNISMAFSNHLLVDRKNTKIQLNESDKIFCFPGNGIQQVKLLLKDYIGLDSKMIREIINLPSDWVMISQFAPRYVLYETGAFVI